MKYKFPRIETINDVLPHIEGRDEFIVAEREGFTVINYVVAMKETFDMEGPDDHGGAIRRECRGIIFYPDGRIMSRPFHKFFNIGEREETQIENIDLSEPYSIMEKMDGSMIRPLIINGEMRLGTKMGLTDIAEDAEAWLNDKSMVAREWIRNYVDEGYTPIFEWISPANKIVVDYKGESRLVLLAIRNNVTGEYFKAGFNIFETPMIYESEVGDLGEYIEKHRGDKGREGFIMRFNNGHMLKGKNDWYVLVHKTKDRIRTERHVVNIILNEELDDLLPLLDKPDYDLVREVESRFWKAFKIKENRLYGLYLSARNMSKKEFAIQVMPTLEYKEDASFIFSMMDGKDLRTLMLQKVLIATSNTTKYDQTMKWLTMC